MSKIKLLAVLLLSAAALGLGLSRSGSGVQADPHPGQSVNVAIVSGTGVINGGSFPTTTSGPTGAFTAFSFFTLAVGSVSAANLGPGGVCGAPGCDSVLLNVASSGMGCSTGGLTAGQKTDLVNFVAGGKKLIIYDSECSAIDYSWLPFPFTTANPGAAGASGTATIVEENTLSSSDAGNSHYINATALGSQTDAIGDMNVATTFDPNWCLDIRGTNAIPAEGPVHMYAEFGAVGSRGLIIYDGMDVDAMGTSTSPTSATPSGNLAKLWLQQLQQPFNPSGLPCSAPVVGGLDHFRCYEAGRRDVQGFAPRTVYLEDQFEAKNTRVVGPLSFCNPVEKTVDETTESIKNPEAHLACYSIVDVRGQPRFTPRDVPVSNQFGDQTLTVKRARALCLPSTKNEDALGPANAAPNIDHFKCYDAKIKPRGEFTPVNVHLEDQFQSKETVVITPRLLCNPVSKDGEEIVNESGHLVCYLAKDVPRQTELVPQVIDVENQFGLQTWTTWESRMLCVPSTKEEPG